MSEQLTKIGEVQTRVLLEIITDKLEYLKSHYECTQGEYLPEKTTALVDIILAIEHARRY